MPKIIPQFQSEEQGLTESEAFARRTDLRILARQKKEKAARKERLRKRIFSILNLTILVFTISLLLLRDLWGAVGTMGALIFNISVNTFQETRSARKMQELTEKVRPYATVIRGGRLSPCPGARLDRRADQPRLGGIQRLAAPAA